MARRVPTKARIPASEAADPESLGAWMLRFLEWSRQRNFAEFTIQARAQQLAVFLAWCKERSFSRPVEITRAVLQLYQRHVFHYRKKNGEPLSFLSQSGRMQPVVALFKWLTRQNVLLYNPASDLEMPRREKRIPPVLTPGEAEAVMASADLSDPWGVRDRAILETIYSTGIRRLELTRLRLFDLNLERRTVMVRQGKGKKDRVVPIGERAAAWVRKYLDEVRPSLLLGPDDGTLFLTHLGEAYTPDGMSRLVRRYVKETLGKRGGCHLLRHTMATAMLENGADIRFIQEILGHTELSTTQLYTRVSITKLREVHAATHPAASLGRTERPAGTDPPGDEQAEATEPEDAEDLVEAPSKDSDPTSP